MKTTVKDLVVLRGTEGIGLMVSVPFREAEDVQKLQESIRRGKTLEVEIKPLSKARTLSANNYYWQLCDEIAKKLSQEKVYYSKEDVYREAIKDCGPYRNYHFMDKESLEYMIKGWTAGRVGRIVIVTGDYEADFYLGSREYNREQMSRLIDCLLAMAEEQGVKLRPRADIEEMLNKWGNKDDSKSKADTA